jgi:PAS domain S-box-containing protein
MRSTHHARCRYGHRRSGRQKNSANGRISRKARGEGRTYKINHRVRRFDGAYRLMQACAIPVKDEEGEVVEWFGMHIDLDEPERW